MPDESPDNAADLWLNLKSRVHQVRDALRPLPGQWHYNPSLDIPRDDAETQWIAACAHYRVAVDDWIDIWLRTGSTDEPNEEIRYFLCVRFDVAHELLTYLTYVRHGTWTTIVPFPPDGPDATLRRLLIDWWYGIGQFRFFQRAYDNKMMPE